MHLAQGTDPIRIATNNPNFSFIQNDLRPSFFLKTAINLLLGVAGVASFIYLLWGGLQWIMAGGDKDAIEKARRKIIAALVGLAIVFSSYAGLYIIRALFNVNLIQVEISQLGSIGGGGGGGSPTSTSGPPGSTDPPPIGYCSCGGGAVGYCTTAGSQGGLTYGGDCYQCQADGTWVHLPGTAPCPILTCYACP